MNTLNWGRLSYMDLYRLFIIKLGTYQGACIFITDLYVRYTSDMFGCLDAYVQI